MFTRQSYFFFFNIQRKCQKKRFFFVILHFVNTKTSLKTWSDTLFYGLCATT